MQQIKKASFLSKLSVSIFIGSVIILPIFFLPYVPVSVNSSKGVFFAIAILVSFVLWLVSVLIEGSFVFPKNKLVLFSVLIPIVFFVSAIFSKSYGNSFWGGGFNIGTVSSMIIVTIALFLSVLYIQKVRALSILLGLYVSGVVVLIFSIIKMFLAESALSLGGVLFGKTSTLVGSWSDLGLLAGLILIISVLLVEVIPLNRKIKILLSVLSILPIVVLIAVNSLTAWILVGLAALFSFVYKLSFSRKDNEKAFPVKSFIVVIISLFFVIANPLVGSIVPAYLNVGSSEIRPSISSTISVAGQVVSHDPVLGIGPNNFSDAWSLYKTKGINLTQFWNASFNSGFGLIPTFLVTTGVLGALVWLFFVIFFVVQAFYSIGKRTGDVNLIFGTVLIAMYLLVSMIVSVPSVTIVALAFVFIGIFIALISNEQNFFVISFLDDPRKSFFSILGIVGAIALVFGLGFGFIKKFSGIISLGIGINKSNVEATLNVAEKNLVRAVVLSGDDFSYRALSQFYLIRLGDLLGRISSSEKASIQPELQQLILKIENSAQSAIAYNPHNISNWLSLANMYEQLVPIGVEQSYENAKKAYEHMLTISPNNPLVFMRLANLEFKEKNISVAREYIQSALIEKQNYVDAYLLLSVIEQQSGDSLKAIQYLQTAVSIEPRDGVVVFNLGLALYGNGQYTNAIPVFERSVLLNPRALDSRYYLALAYNKVGRSAEAIVQMQMVQGQLPDNTEIAAVLEKMRLGQDIDDSGTIVDVENNEAESNTDLE